jgi:hypothetical protein
LIEREFSWVKLLRDVKPLADILRQHKELGCLGARMSNGEGVVVDNAGWFPSPIRLMLCQPTS